MRMFPGSIFRQVIRVHRQINLKHVETKRCPKHIAKDAVARCCPECRVKLVPSLQSRDCPRTYCRDGPKDAYNGMLGAGKS